MATALVIRVAFPGGVYRGAEMGDSRPEELPSPARLYAGLVAAAAGGPYARRDGRLLVATERHRAAVEHLERHRPLGILVPSTRPVTYTARRYRHRVAFAMPSRHNDDTDFEPFSAISGEIAYVWPAPDDATAAALAELAVEVTHVGRADAIAVVRAGLEYVNAGAEGFLAAAEGRGPGRSMRVPAAGRFAALVEQHASMVRPGNYPAGSKGRQAKDELPALASDTGTEVLRFASVRPRQSWPFRDVWQVATDCPLPAWALRPQHCVSTAVGIHRALVAEVGEDVPAFITGRDGDGPRRGAGHLAIHITVPPGAEEPALLLAIPAEASDADQRTLLEALSRRPLIRIGGRPVRLDAPAVTDACGYWPAGGRSLRTEVPLVLDAAGPPREGSWSLENAVICSIGYALRAVLEGELEWAGGWKFRHQMVEALRERGVKARARRVPVQAARYVHRAREGDLLVAVDAEVELGDLDRIGGSLLALGRARHLGGGLLRPVGE